MRLGQGLPAETVADTMILNPACQFRTRHPPVRRPGDGTSSVPHARLDQRIEFAPVDQHLPLRGPKHPQPFGFDQAPQC